MTISKRSTTPIERSPIEGPILERAARVIKVLGHPTRLRILETLEDGECHVGELQGATGLSQATVSQQLAILRAHGVVDARRDGLRVYYRIVEPRVVKILDCIRECDIPELAEIGTLIPLGDLASIRRVATPSASEARDRTGRRPADGADPSGRPSN